MEYTDTEPLREFARRRGFSPTTVYGWSDKGLFISAIIPADGLAPLEKNWYSGDAVEIFFGRESDDRPFDWTDADDRCYLGFAKSAGSSCVAPWPIRRCAGGSRSSP